MTTIQFTAVMAGAAVTLAALIWVTLESVHPTPSRAYIVLKAAVDQILDAMAMPIRQLFATRVMTRLFR